MTQFQKTWYPCADQAHIKDSPPAHIKHAHGVYLTHDNGHQVLDAISSWWSKSLGHQHPRLKEALIKQVNQFEHAMLTHAPSAAIEELSHELCQLKDNFHTVLYACDGASAVEMALKMSLHSRLNDAPNTQRTQFISLKNGYHGETIGALSVTDLGIYQKAYQSLLFPCHKISIEDAYVASEHNPVWHNCDHIWKNIVKQLDPFKDTATAFIVEPLIQASGHMQIYSCHLLQKIRQWTSEHNIHLICDEIMTGFGRTGKMLASDHADISPDFVCLSKGMTSGYMPFSATITTKKISEKFYNRPHAHENFLHSHTFSGHALSVSVALETVKILKYEFDWQEQRQKEIKLHNAFLQLTSELGIFENVRYFGMMAAADLKTGFIANSELNSLSQKAIKLGLLIRPIGKCFYWAPPLIISDEEIEHLLELSVKLFSRDS